MASSMKVGEGSRSADARRTSKITGAGPTIAIAARRHPLIAEIERGLKRCGVAIDDASRSANPINIAIGVSGGADSVALLLGCAVIAQRRSRDSTDFASRINPIAVHVHHHLRESAEGDAEFVNELCATLDIHVRTAHVFPAELPGNLSANARRLRYEALCRIAIEENAAAVAVAHHGDDQLETMIAALCRGAGLDGLAGMPWKRKLCESITLIRPLLASRRRDCEDLCRAAGIRWRDDPTNSDATKVRARLRRDVIPILEELWPESPRRVSATGDLISAANETLEARLHDVFGPALQRQWERAALQNLSVPILAAGLRRAALCMLPQIADDLGQRHLSQPAQAIASSTRQPQEFHWPGGLVLKVTAKSVSLASHEDRDA